MLDNVNITHLLQEELAAQYTQIQAKGFHVTTDIPDANIYVICDEEAMRRVLQNLIANVVSHGECYLSVALSEKVIIITNEVNNVDDLDITAIFERFYTADASRSNKRTGLGLAITKELMQKMGGRVSAEKKENRLTMTVIFPNNTV